MSTQHIILILVSLLGCIPIVTDNAFSDDKPPYEVVIMSGAIDRHNSIVSFYVPTEIPPGTYFLQEETKNYNVLQVDLQNIGWLIIDELPRYRILRYTLFPDLHAVSDEGIIWKEIGDRKVTFHIKENGVFSYYLKEPPPPDGVDSIYTRAGYIHPVRTPAGVMVTQDFAEVHPHHHGIWSAWTNVEFEGRKPDFWNVGKGTGSVVFDSLDEIWGGLVQAGFRSRLRYVDHTSLNPVTVLNEHWTVRLYNIEGEYHIFDIEVTQTANTSNPVILPEYEYGGIGFRGHEDWEGENNAFFLTSEGRARDDGHGTRGRWCHIGGYTGGQLAGIAILDHPGNFRHPQPMHIHPRRTFFNYAAVKLGSMSIEPGNPYRMRYRYITYDGEPDPSELERLWLDYAYPPAVSITVKNDVE
jgi:hypothetical protein